MLKRILDTSLYGVGVAMFLVVSAWAINKGLNLNWFAQFSASKMFFSLAVALSMLFLAQILAPLFSVNTVDADNDNTA